jgi:hypothetical protein
MEYWKDIPGYEGLYQASNLGQIRSHPTKTTYVEVRGVRHWKVRILKPKHCADFNTCGYRVSLWKDGKSKDYLVARLVATTFHENLIDTKMTVNHKDGNRLNNLPENLEWLTLGDNIRHGFDTGLYPQAKICLTDKNGNRHICRSMAKAGEVIGRGPGYIFNCVKNSREAMGINGSKYTISKV